MDHSEQHKNRKLQGALLIAMLLLFAVVYNRRWIMNRIDPQPQVASSDQVPARALNQWNRVRADSCLSIVRNGDLVLRSGSDALSALFRKVNTKDKTYSHAGIVFIENGYPMVYHSIGSASDPHALLRRDSLRSYIGPADNIGYALYRYRLKPAQFGRLHDIAIRYFKEKRSFDPHFDLSTDSALYCTEFVYKAILETTGDRGYLPVTQASGFRFITTDNLFLRKDMVLVCKIAYKQ